MQSLTQIMTGAFVKRGDTFTMKKQVTKKIAEQLAHQIQMSPSVLVRIDECNRPRYRNVIVETNLPPFKIYV